MPVEQHSFQPASAHTRKNHTPGNAPAWLTIMARAGYLVRGLLYLIIGFLALLQAFGAEGEEANSKGAIQQLLSALFGNFLLWVVAVCLAGYAIWRLIQAILNTDNHEQDATGLSIRAELLARALTHSFLAFYAGSAALNQSGSGSSSSKSWTNRILQ